MPASSKMTLSAAFGFISGAVALANGVSTETVSAQQVGSTTIDGAMVYSMNYCSVVHDTICQVSLSTGGPAPSVSVSTEGAESASAAESTTTAYESIPYPLPSAGESSSASSAQVTAGNSPPGGAVSSSASESASNTGSGQDHETTGPEPTAVPTGTSAAMGVAGVANAAVFGAVAVGALFALM